MKVRDYLNISYILEAQPVEMEDGQWKRRLSYPELGDIYAEGVDVEQVYLDIERLRITEIIRRLKIGDLPPVPRPPLQTSDPVWWANYLGIADLIADQIDKTPEQLSGS